MVAGCARAHPASIAAMVGKTVVRCLGSSGPRPHTRTVDLRAGAPTSGSLGAVGNSAARGNCIAPPVWPTRPGRIAASQFGTIVMRDAVTGNHKQLTTSPMMLKESFSSWASASELLTAPPSTSISAAGSSMTSSFEGE